MLRLCGGMSYGLKTAISTAMHVFCWQQGVQVQALQEGGFIEDDEVNT